MFKLFLLTLASIFYVNSSFAKEAFELQGLGFLGGGLPISRAEAVSADGRVIVGSSSSINSIQNDGPPEVWSEAFIWREGQMTGLGDLPGDSYFHSVAYDVSGDGTTVVGGSLSLNSRPEMEGFRWKLNEGMQALGVVYNNKQQGSPAYAISSDGNFISGYVRMADGWRAYLWTEKLGLQPLDNPFRRTAGGISTDISSEAKLLVGQEFKSVFRGDGYKVYCVSPTVASVSDLLWQPVFKEDRLCGTVSAVSTNAHHIAVIGVEYIENESYPASYFLKDFNSSGENVLPILPLPGDRRVKLNAISNEGTYGVGFSESVDGSKTAIVWTEEFGTKTLLQPQSRKNIEYNSFWRLQEATGMSADGRVIVGAGINLQGQPEAFVFRNFMATQVRD